jgi:hypothetical protein
VGMMNKKQEISIVLIILFLLLVTISYFTYVGFSKKEPLFYKSSIIENMNSSFFSGYQRE